MHQRPVTELYQELQSKIESIDHALGVSLTVVAQVGTDQKGRPIIEAQTFDVFTHRSPEVLVALAASHQKAIGLWAKAKKKNGD